MTSHYEVWYWDGDVDLPDADHDVNNCGPVNFPDEPVNMPFPRFSELADARKLLDLVTAEDPYAFNFRIVRVGREVIEQEELGREGA